VIPATLDNATQGEVQMYENNYKVLNLIITALGRNVYDHVFPGSIVPHIQTKNVHR
jgi:hypothetical protein